MAAYAAYRAGNFGANSPINLAILRGFVAATSTAPPSSRVDCSSSRHISQLVKSNGKRLFLVDTLALVIFYPSLSLSIGIYYLYVCLWFNLRKLNSNVMYAHRSGFFCPKIEIGGEICVRLGD